MVPVRMCRCWRRTVGTRDSTERMLLADTTRGYHDSRGKSTCIPLKHGRHARAEQLLKTLTWRCRRFWRGTVHSRPTRTVL